MLRRGFQAWGRWVVRRQLRRGLDGVFVRGAHTAGRLAARGPLLLAANHVSWWDGLVGVALDDVLGVERRVLMHQHRLEAYPFFRAFGAIGLDTRRRALARDGLGEMIDWLSAPGRVGWVFPQGRQRPAHLRPLELAPGVGFIARRAGVPVVPVAISYVFREGSIPSAYVDFGSPIPASEPQLLAVLERAVEAGLERIDGAGGFELALPARARPERGARVLSWLWRATGGLSWTS